MLTTPNIQELFEPISREVFRRLNIVGTFTYGSSDEVIELLAQLAKSDKFKSEVFPLIALVGNVPIDCGEETCYGEGSFNFVLAKITLQNYTSKQRIENSYIPTLRPMAATLIDEIIYSNAFDIQNGEKLSYGIEERLNFGRSQLFTATQTATDFIDVTEITNLKLKIK